MHKMDETLTQPLVAVKSFGRLNAKEIIENLLKYNKSNIPLPDECASIKTTEINTNISGYKCKIFTKYFENEVVLIDLDGINLESLEGQDFERHFEVAFFCFDKADDLAQNYIDDMYSFICRNGIDVPVIIFFHDPEADNDKIDEDIGRQLLTIGSFTLIDLYNRENEYHELYDLLRNHVWSNITVLNNCSSQMYQSNRNTTGQPSPSSFNSEEELSNFESLLQSVEQFRETAKTLPREALLDNAEMLAEKFAELLGEDN